MVASSARRAVALELDPRPSRAWVEWDSATLWIELVAGRTLGVPSAWLPTIEKAGPADRAAVKIERDGHALRWEALDEDIAVPHLVGLTY